MHSSIISLVALSLSLLSLTQAAPLAPTSDSLLKRTTDAMCASEGRVYHAPGSCPSGYVGCGSPAGPDNVICNSNEYGPYSQSCGVAAGAFNLGQWYECPDNGFVGCHTIDACSLDSNGQKKSTTPPTPPQPPVPNNMDIMCASEGRVYHAPGTCASGYIGCGSPAGSDNVICNSDEYGPYTKSCGSAAGAFNLGQWYECPSNGFVGCHTLDACSLDSNGQKKSTPTPPPTPPAPKGCAQGTTYFGRGACSSGFVGCAADAQICGGARRFYQGDCPAGTGVFQSCGNGFVGCTTAPNVCG